MEVDEHEWELSKENVQPLRQGRHMSSLAAALRTDQNDHQTIKTEQNNFEVELRTYSGDDPFDVWDRYVKWTEQHFPKGGHDGQLMMLIERCLREFQADQRYTNDTRFIQMWIKFANSSDDPVIIYTYMFDNGIGVKVAALYMEWAVTLERMGDTKRADAIYTEGLNRGAEPKELLVQRHQQFQMRVARNITLQIGEGLNPGMDMGEAEEKRSALGRLKAAVGTTRTGSVVLGSAGRLKDTRAVAPKQKPDRGIQIYSDAENLPPNLNPQQTKEWQSMPVKAVDNRENDKKPGIWTDAKVKQRPGTVLSAPKSLGFQIHEDPESEKFPEETPKKTTFINVQPLSSHKAVQKDVLSNLRQAPAKADGDLEQRPMYQKYKIYNGLLEFSFEELRAVKYWKQKKQKEVEAERLRQEEERRLREEMLQKQLQETNARVAAMEALLQAQMGGLNINTATEQQTQQHLPPEQQPQDTHRTSQEPQQPAHLYQNVQNQIYRGDQPLSSQRHAGHPAENQPMKTAQTSESLSKLPKQGVINRSVTNSGDSDFVTPTNEILPPTSSQVKSSGTGKSQIHNSSLNSSQRTPIFNSMSAYSSGGSVSSSSFNRSHTRPLTTAASANTSTTTPSTMDHLPMEHASALSSSLSTSLSSQGKLNRTTTPGSGGPASLSNSVSSQGKLNRTTPKSGAPTPESIDHQWVKKGPLTAPSPTVCTKEAMQCVMELFSTSLTCDQQMTEEVESFSAPAVSTGNNAPFQIREDTMAGGLPAPAANCNVPFQIREDTMAGGLPAPATNRNAPFQIREDAMPGGPAAVPFQIREDTVYAGSESGGQNLKSSSKNEVLQIYSDDMDSKENVLKGTVPRSNVKIAGSCGKGLQIHHDEPEDKENSIKPVSLKKGARRGLGFHQAATSEDEEMTEFQHINYDFTIECQAKNDMTLAPLGDSFRLQARAASTPCASMSNKSQVSAQEISDVASTCSTSSAVTANYSESAPTPNKHLSPIFEGSGEGSGEDTKSTSHQSQTASGICANITTRKRHGSSLSRDPIREDVEMMEDDAQDISMRDEQILDRSCHHQIDTTAYVHDVEDKAEDLLSTSICIDPKDPFDDKTIATFLDSLDPPITEYPNYMTCEGPMPDPSTDLFLNFGELYVCIDKCIGEGGYAKVYKVTETCLEADDTISMDSAAAPPKVIKVQTPSCFWEFYISCELRRRLQRLRAPVDVMPSVMEVERGLFFDDGSILQMNFVPFGSLLNLVNRYKNDRNRLSNVEPFACLLTIELLHLFEQIHKCNFIHGDVKPDNFLLLGLPDVKSSQDPRIVFGSKLRLVQLIDFGQSIDMTKFKKGTTFMAKVVTSGFQCIEMRTDRPWTFQTDLFGLAGTIHVVLFGSYMNVFQEHGEWRVTGNFIRKWNVPLWKHLFKELLNVPSCDQQPDLAALRAHFEEHFIQNLIPAYNSWVQDMRLLEIGSDC